MSPRVAIAVVGLATALGIAGCSSTTTQAASTTPPPMASTAASPVASTTPIVSPHGTSIPGSATTSPAPAVASTSAAPGTMPPSLSVLQTAATAPPTTVVSITIPVTVPPTDTGATPNTIIININAVEQAVDSAAANFDACYQAPTLCAPSTVYAPASPELASFRSFIATAIASGKYLAPDLRGSYQVVEKLDFPSSNEAVATVCTFDAATTLGPSGSDGRPTVVDDTMTSRRTEQKLVVVGDEWMVSQVSFLEQLGEGNRCAAKH